MIIGIPKEIKDSENRVAITPAGVHALIERGHQIYLEDDAGENSSFHNKDYQAVGAEILSTPQEVFEKANLILKVKEPQKSEYDMMRSEQLLFTYLHLAAVKELAIALMERNVTAIAYETVQSDSGDLPLLKPMSEVAGRASVQIGAHLLEKPQGGKGMLLGGVPGVNAGHVVIIGGGVVGMNAAEMAIGLGAQVTILDNNADRLRFLDSIYSGRIEKLMSNSFNIAHAVKQADLLIGAVLIPGAKAPNLVTEAMVKTMRSGSVIVDVAVDQGGTIETIDHVTTHSNPTYIKHDVIHYAVANMPGIVPRTSTIALTNVTLPYIIELADKGFEQAIHDDQALAKGVNIYQGKCVHQAVADALNIPYSSLI